MHDAHTGKSGNNKGLRCFRVLVEIKSKIYINHGKFDVLFILRKPITEHFERKETTILFSISHKKAV